MVSGPPTHPTPTAPTSQAVLAKEARSTLLYYTALFAAVDIPAFTELTYDYGAHTLRGRDGCEGVPVFPAWPRPPSGRGGGGGGPSASARNQRLSHHARGFAVTYPPLRS